MDKAVVVLLSFLAACTFVFKVPGATGGRRLLQQLSLTPELDRTWTNMNADNKAVLYDKGKAAWIISGGAVRPSPPPPSSSFGRGNITPVTAAVGLVVAGFVAGLLVIAVILWARNSVSWDFRFKDIFMVWLGRRRLMPVVPRDSLTPASAGTAAAAAVAAADQEQQDHSPRAVQAVEPQQDRPQQQQQPGEVAGPGSDGVVELSAGSGAEGQRRSEELRHRTVAPGAGSLPGFVTTEGRGGRSRVGEIVAVIDMEGTPGISRSGALAAPAGGRRSLQVVDARTTALELSGPRAGALEAVP